MFKKIWMVHATKSVLAMMLVMGLTAGLAGCGKQGETVQTKATDGRYIEKEISLPEDIDPTGVFQLGKEEGNLCLYAIQEKSGKKGFVSFRYQKGAFEDRTPQWLADVSFDEKQMDYYANKRIIENIAGKSYLYCALMENESWIGHLYCSADGKTIEEITPIDWLTEDEEYHYFECPQDIAILSDGTVVAYFMYKIRIYDSNTYTMIKEIPLPKQYDEHIFFSADSYYLIAKNDNYEFGGIEFFEGDDENPQTTITCTETIGGSNFIDTLSDGSLILTGQKGIMKLQAGNEKWTQVVDGIYTSFAVHSMWCIGMTALDTDVYYALFLDDSEKAMLMEYAFDPTVPSKPETVLTVYSVYDNASIQQAAAIYTKQNPEVVVEVETGVAKGEEETADKNTILQNLNAKLIAHEGADVLVLDGLPTDSFREKGILKDISNIITPMSNEGILLKNITDIYTNEDGSVYMVPLKFSMNLLIGDEIDAEKANTVENMAQELSEQTEPVFGPMTVQDLVADYVPYMVKDIVKDGEIDKEVLTEKLSYLKQIADNGGIVEVYPEHGRRWNIWEVAADAGAAFENTAGFLDAMLPLAMVKQVNGTFTCFENAFYPIGEVGINADSKQTEIAEDFLKFALSFEMQDGDFYDGFPINIQALENQTTKDRSGYAAYTEIEAEDGQYIPFVIDALDAETNQKLVELCKGVNKKAVQDEKIEEVISQVLPSYINSYSLEDTVTQIEKGLSMYLAE